MKKKFLVFFLIASVLSVTLLFLVQALLMPKYMESSQEGALIAEYYDNKGNNDVIFVGDCEVYENFSPITLYEEYGITSYIRGSAQQMIWQSYYLMEETLKYEKPKAFVFNVLSMKYDTPESTGDSSQREAYNRMTLDGMRWSGSKWNSIMASLTEQEKEKESIFSYIFPLLRYHDRWSSLESQDFTYLFKKKQLSDNGYLMQTGIKPATNHNERRPKSFDFGENSYKYLDMMVELCEKNGGELILVKAPSLSPKWWPQWDKQMEDYAKEHNLAYYNLLDITEEIGIDWQTDTYDTGLHLNVYGAEKLASYFGKILKDEHNISDRRNDKDIAELWAEKCETYHNRKKELTATK